MTQEVLFLGRQFREPAAVGQLEDGVEAKAVRATRLGRDRAGQDSFAGKDSPVRQGQHRRGAEERRRRAGHRSAEGLEQRGDERATVPLVLGAGEICRIDAGSAAEQRDFESRVVRQRRQPAQPPAGLGLLARVLQVAGSVLNDVENDPRISRADQLHRYLAQDRAQLLELARVRRGEQQPVQRSFSAFFWASTSSAAPLTASLSICSISSGLNGSCSAVPWISMKRPSSASTQFMSVWAAKSSR